MHLLEDHCSTYPKKLVQFGIEEDWWPIWDHSIGVVVFLALFRSHDVLPVQLIAKMPTAVRPWARGVLDVVLNLGRVLFQGAWVVLVDEIDRRVV